MIHLEYSLVWCWNLVTSESRSEVSSKFGLWCIWRTEISWTDRVRNEETLHRVKEDRNILHTIKRTKANWIGPMVRRNCLLKHFIEGKIERRIEVTESWRRRRRKQLLDGGGENAERGSTRSHCEENSLWKRLWTCCRHNHEWIFIGLRACSPINCIWSINRPLRHRPHVFLVTLSFVKKA